jgi:tetratricopeptide (TPR) repeat protein
MPTDSNPPPPFAELEAAVHRTPGDVAAWRELAGAYWWADEVALALAVLEHAARIAPWDVETRRSAGHVLRELGRPRDAIPHYREALRLDPESAADGELDLGAALDEAGDHAAAVPHFRRAVELEPRMGAGWLRLGWALLRDGKPSEAIRAFDTASRYRPKSARLWHGLGLAYADTDQHERAVQAFRLSLRIDPLQPEVEFQLGESCRRLGIPDESVAALAAAA